MGDLAGILPLILIVVLFWLLILRPQMRRAKSAQQTQRAAGPGNQIMLTSGIYGTVLAAEDDTLSVEIAPGISIKVARGAVARVIEPRPAPTAEYDAE